MGATWLAKWSRKSARYYNAADNGEASMDVCSAYHYGSVSHPGLVRELNEDCLGFYPAGAAVLLVVADGMGGHNAGEVASRICVETLRDAFLKGEGGDPATVLREGVLQAGENILRQSSADSNLRGMGTTVVAAIVRGRECWYSHLGDSRLYLVHAGKLERLTRDHTVVQDLLDHGLITEQQTVGHHMAHVLSKALGHLQPAGAEILVGKTTLQEGGGLLLCSDGLTDFISEDEIHRSVKGRQPQEACHDLLELVLMRGGHDNVSILLLRPNC